MKDVAIELAFALREHVRPLLGSQAGRSRVRAGAGGDVTFAIDSDAESFLERFMGERAPGVAFYSEDRGLVLQNNSDFRLGAKIGSSEISL